MKGYIKKVSTAVVAAMMTVSLLPTVAFGEVTSLPDDTSERVLNIYKYSPTATGDVEGDGTENGNIASERIPLENVQFDIYDVPDGQSTSRTPSTEEINAIQTSENLEATVTTDESGLASYSFGVGSENDGIYMVVEQPNPAIVETVDPFYVNIPLTSPDEDAWLYTVNVYPKNDVVAGPGVDKDVNTVGNDSATNDIRDIQTWIIRGDVPADLCYESASGEGVYAKNYSFVDNLASALNYVGDLRVKLYDKSGKETELDYSYYSTEGTTAESNVAGGSLVVSLTNEGMKFISENLGSGSEEPEIRVYFDTVINESAILGTDIYNYVGLDYTNSANKTYETSYVDEQEAPEVHTGGIMIDKFQTGARSTKLEGATFKIARDANDEDRNLGYAENLKVGGDDKSVVYVDFYNTELMDGTAVEEVITDADGKAVISGLAYGTYYLVELKAPDGYNLLSAPVVININDTSHLAGNEVLVDNSAKFVLPVTGGEGTILFTLAGALLIGASLTLILYFGIRKSVRK